MKQYKFRVWDKQHKMFVIEAPNGGLSFADIRLSLNGNLVWETEYANGELDKNRYIIQQFTNFQDKTGKDIYEGDFLEIEDSEYYFEVSQLPIGLYVASAVKHGSIDYVGNINTKSTIVGNIFETTEL